MHVAIREIITFSLLVNFGIVERVRGTGLTLVKEAMTKGLLPLTILPPSIPPSTTLPPHRRLVGGGGQWGGRVVEGWTEGGRLVDGRRPSVMASLTKVRAVPRTLLRGLVRTSIAATEEEK